GSETVTGYQISGVPAGYSLNHGTHIGGGVWSLTAADLVGLTISAPTNFVGSLTLTGKVLNAETNLSGTEADTADNTNSNTAPITVTWQPVSHPPSITVNNGVDNAVVKEDGTIDVPVVATLNALSSP